MAVDVAHHAAHVVDVVLANVFVVPLEDLDDPASRLVTLGLSPIVALPNGLRLVGFEPLFELVGVYVYRLPELFADLLITLSHVYLPKTRLASTRPPAPSAV